MPLPSGPTKMIFRFLAAITAVSIVFIPACVDAPKVPSTTKVTKVVILSLDGMANWLLDRLLAEGRMPNIQRLLQNGVKAQSAITSYPAKTAVAHATLWTGTDPSRNGIHGNSAIVWPYDESTILDVVSGFNSDALMAEPVWVTAARQNKKAVVVQATQIAPFERFLGENARFPAPPENLTIFDGYYNRLLFAEIIEPESTPAAATAWVNLPPHEGTPLAFAHEIGDAVFHFLIYDDGDNAVQGFDTIAICSEPDGESVLVTVKPGPGNPNNTELFSDPVSFTVYGQPTAVFFRLFSLSRDTGEFVLYRTESHEFVYTDADAGQMLFQRMGAFTGNAADWSYSRGELGEVFYLGGDGEAERRFVETIRHVSERFEIAVTTAMNNLEWDLLIDYLPFPDGPNHEWLGYIAEPIGDPESEEAKTIWPHLLSVYKLVDEYVGAVYDALPDDAVLMIVSDHGFESSDRLIYPNTILKKAGLLAVSEDVNVDLENTKAMYFAGGANFVLVNSTRFKDGIVDDAGFAAVEQAAKDAFLAARDRNGNPVVIGIFDPDTDDDLDMAGKYAGDFYLIYAPGLYGNSRVDEESITAPWGPSGVHHGDPRVPRMNSIFLICSKKLELPSSLGQVRAIDVAPTACALLGIDPPADATGSAIDEIIRAVVGK